ncbi:hypothetical protein SAMN04487934_11115 [Eubacterium ruminantium]|nr:hypothetical protein SAMN04487934_11115 [Eubacterium ruminantium]
MKCKMWQDIEEITLTSFYKMKKYSDGNLKMIFITPEKALFANCIRIRCSSGNDYLFGGFITHKEMLDLQTKLLTGQILDLTDYSYVECSCEQEAVAIFESKALFLINWAALQESPYEISLNYYPYLILQMPIPNTKQQVISKEELAKLAFYDADTDANVDEWLKDSLDGDDDDEDVEVDDDYEEESVNDWDFDDEDDVEEYWNEDDYIDVKPENSDNEKDMFATDIPGTLVTDPDELFNE